MHWRRKWQPTAVFLPGESQGQGTRWAAVYGVAQNRTRLKRLSSSSSSSQGYGFASVLYGCELDCEESWVRRIDAFELWCWRRLLRVPWTASRSNQSILKIRPGCSLEALMLKLKLQYFGHLMRRVDSLEKTRMLRGIGDRRRRGWQRMRCLDGFIDSMDMSFSKFWESVMDREAWHAVIHGVTKSQTRLSDWTELTELSSHIKDSKNKQVNIILIIIVVVQLLNHVGLFLSPWTATC